MFFVFFLSPSLSPLCFSFMSSTCSLTNSFFSLSNSRFALSRPCRAAERIVQRCAFLALAPCIGLAHLNPLHIRILYIFVFPSKSSVDRAPCLSQSPSLPSEIFASHIYFHHHHTSIME